MFIISYEEETLYASHMVCLVGEIKQYIEMFSSKAVRDLMSLLLLTFHAYSYEIKLLSLPTLSYSFLPKFHSIRFIQILPIRSLYDKSRNHFNYIYSSFWVCFFFISDKDFWSEKERQSHLIFFKTIFHVESFVCNLIIA